MVSPLTWLFSHGYRRGLINKISGKSGRYFGAQQHWGLRNGFIEEMMSVSGQGLCAWKRKHWDFDRINDRTSLNPYQANRYANVLMPILGNLGNVSFVLTALIGGLLR